MILENKNAIIYGAGRSLGGAVALAMAKEGAKVFLTGDRLKPVKELAEKINQNGENAEFAQVDALDEDQVNSYISNLITRQHALDICFNAIGIQDVQGTPLIEMELDDFVRPIITAMKTQFITARAAGKVMKKQGCGIILSLTASPGGIGYAYTGGFGPACCAIESLMTNLATELGPFGVRAVNIRSAGSPGSRVFKATLANGGKEFIEKIKNDTMLKQLPLMEDIAHTAVFLASAKANKITGCTVDVTCGTTQALNYKVTPIAFVS